MVYVETSKNYEVETYILSKSNGEIREIEIVYDKSENLIDVYFRIKDEIEGKEITDKEIEKLFEKMWTLYEQKALIESEIRGLASRIIRRLKS